MISAFVVIRTLTLKMTATMAQMMVDSVFREMILQILRILLSSISSR
jgi:hypothetical protein